MNLRLIQTSKLVSASSLRSLTNLRTFSLKLLHNSGFDLGDLPAPSLDSVSVFGGQRGGLRGFESLRNFTRLRKLTLRRNDLERFRFDSLPRSLLVLQVKEQKLSEIGPKSCAHLKTLSQLYLLDFSANKFSEFDFSCLPNVPYLDFRLNNNLISAFNIHKLSHFPLMRLQIWENPLRCNCSTVKEVVNTANVELYCPYESCGLCEPSPLRSYPWDKNVTK